MRVKRIVCIISLVQNALSFKHEFMEIVYVVSDCIYLLGDTSHFATTFYFLLP